MNMDMLIDLCERHDVAVVTTRDARLELTARATGRVLVTVPIKNDDTDEAADAAAFAVVQLAGASIEAVLDAMVLDVIARVRA